MVVVLEAMMNVVSRRLGDCAELVGFEFFTVARGQWLNRSQTSWSWSLGAGGCMERTLESERAAAVE